MSQFVDVPEMSLLPAGSSLPTGDHAEWSRSHGFGDRAPAPSPQEAEAPWKPPAYDTSRAVSARLKPAFRRNAQRSTRTSYKATPPRTVHPSWPVSSSSANMSTPSLASRSAAFWAIARKRAVASASARYRSASARSAGVPWCSLNRARRLSAVGCVTQSSVSWRASALREATHSRPCGTSGSEGAGTHGAADS